MKSYTLCLSYDEMQELGNAYVDAAIRWYHVWRDCVDGKNSDIMPEFAKEMNQKNWKKYEELQKLMHSV